MLLLSRLWVTKIDFFAVGDILIIKIHVTCKRSSHLWIERAEARPHPSTHLIKHLKRKIKIHGKWEAWVGWARTTSGASRSGGGGGGPRPGFLLFQLSLSLSPSAAQQRAHGPRRLAGICTNFAVLGSVHRSTALILLSSLLLKFHLSRPDPL